MFWEFQNDSTCSLKKYFSKKSSIYLYILPLESIAENIHSFALPKIPTHMVLVVYSYFEGGRKQNRYEIVKGAVEGAEGGEEA